MNQFKSSAFITRAAIIAALYVVLTLVFAPISFSEVQVRISEVLTILPFFTPAAIPGLFIGCLIANILGGAVLPDIIFGSIATLLGAIGSYLLRRNRFLVTLPPVIANTVIVPLVLRFAYGVNLPMWILFLSIAAGEAISCIGLGSALIAVLKRYQNVLFPAEGNQEA